MAKERRRLHSIYIHDDVWIELEKLAEKERVSISHCIRKAIEDLLKKRETER